MRSQYQTKHIKKHMYITERLGESLSARMLPAERRVSDLDRATH